QHPQQGRGPAPGRRAGGLEEAGAVGEEWSRGHGGVLRAWWGRHEAAPAQRPEGSPARGVPCRRPALFAAKKVGRDRRPDALSDHIPPCLTIAISAKVRTREIVTAWVLR